MPVACGVLCSLCDMTGLTARQGQAPRANPGTLHTLWLRHSTVFAIVKSVLCLLFRRHNRFVEDEVQEGMQEREKGVQRRTPTRLVDLASADPCATSHARGMSMLLLFVIHPLTIYTDKPGSLFSRITIEKV